MATSLLVVPNDHQTMNTNLPATHDQHRQPTRRASGRRKPKVCDSSASGQKKKVAQRGMGVEKLEALRMQETWKRMAEMNNTTLDLNGDPALVNFTAAAAATVLPKPAGFVAPSVTQMGLTCHNNDCVGFRGPMLAPDQVKGICKNVSGNSKEQRPLTPNAAVCLYENCNACHKKKKFHGQNLCVGGGRSDISAQMHNVGHCGFLGFNIGYNENKFTQENQMGCVFGNGKEGVEVVAVHRRGSARSGAGSVLMEYEFFPHQRTESSPSSFSFPSSSSSADAGFRDLNQLDLSLKLSY